MINSIPSFNDENFLVECPVCVGTDRECSRCAGTGQVPFADLTNEEKDAWGWLTMDMSDGLD